METVSVNTCVSPRIYNFAKTSAPQPLCETKQVFNSAVAQNNVDTVSIRDKKEIYLEQLNKLFPNGSINSVYNKINEDFGIDKPAELNFVGDNDGIQAGGYTFAKNKIDMSLSDLLGSDTKIVGIKDGKRVILTSPNVKLPLFVDKNSAEQFINMQSQNGNLGFDKLVAEPLTEDEQRKFVIQKLAHEVVHSQQHMILRRTEGIGEKEVLKVWSHNKPKNLVDRAVLNIETNRAYDRSYWKNQSETEKTIKADSPTATLATIWLEAIRNYPPVDSPEYDKNPIELDAYNRSADYVEKTLGGWN